MPKFLEFYHSFTSNTPHTAVLVAQDAAQLKDAEVSLRSKQGAIQVGLSWRDGNALRSPMNHGRVLWQMKQWRDLRPIKDGRNRHSTIGSVLASARTWWDAAKIDCRDDLRPFKPMFKRFPDFGK